MQYISSQNKQWQTVQKTHNHTKRKEGQRKSYQEDRQAERN